MKDVFDPIRSFEPLDRATVNSIIRSFGPIEAIWYARWTAQKGGE